MRNDSIYKIVFTLLICALFWIIGYYNEVGLPLSDYGFSLLWKKICKIFNIEKTTLYLFGFFLLCLGAALLQWFNFIFVIIKEKTVMPFLLFLLLNSTNSNLYPLRPISFILFLLIISMFELYSFQKNQNTIGRMFNITFYLCVGSLMWPHVLLFIPVFWIGMYQLRVLNMRSMGASLLGIFTVVLYALGWCSWIKNLDVFKEIFQSIADINLIFFDEMWLIKWFVPLCIFLSMFLVTFVKNEYIIHAQKSILFILTFGFFSFILTLFYANYVSDFLCVFYIPASIILSFSFSGKRTIFKSLLYYFFVFFLLSTGMAFE